MRMRHLASHLLKPGGARQDNVSEAARRFVQEQVIADNQRGPLQPQRHIAGIGIRRQHIRAHQQQGLDAPIA